ncbi:DUF1853 family protein [Bizionia sediminis]|uniref:DUF1853 family protein n=1 Tax=Bizionia sediminis TaxID=1737064 RepID=A0ABW5KQE1_9FLAO
MHSEKNSIQDQYFGYVNTPNLWHNKSVFNIQQFDFAKNLTKTTFKRILPPNLRLGKRVEQFVLNNLEQQKGLKILAETIQIQQNKETIGELDAILTYNLVPIHLEIVYKFYVYDPTVGSSEIDHLIGPNRKDLLTEKLNKLKNKQFPLLYRPETQPYLEHLGLNAAQCQQAVCFKAQLFVPLNINIKLTTVNQACVVGYYISIAEVLQFKNSLFYFPSKADWLIFPHHQVVWESFTGIQRRLQNIKNNQYAACCWIKQANKPLIKVFIVWW